MSLRLPLPVRLLQPSLVNSHPSLLFLYKPSGLPLFASSQLAAATSPHDEVVNLSRLITPSASTQPGPEDTSDSLFSRLEDAAGPGTTTYLALNPVAAPLLSAAASSAFSSSSSLAARAIASAVPHLLAREKGVVVMAPSQAEAHFVQNAAQLGLVRQRFHVLCQLPDGVAENARKHTRRRAQSTSMDRKMAQNPYLRAYLDKRGTLSSSSPPPSASSFTRTRDGDGGEWLSGIPIWDLQTQQLPSSLSAHRFSGVRNADGTDGTGRLFNYERGLLRYHGSLVAELGLPVAGVTPDTSSAASGAENSTSPNRLARLFESPAPLTSASRTGAAGEATATHARSGRHPWIDAGTVLRVLTTAELDGPRGARTGQRGRAPSGGGRHRIEVDFRLLNISDQAGNPLALYEVSGHVTAEEIQALFHAEGCTVFNDFTRDLQLAEAMKLVADAVHELAKAPSSGVSLLPARTQHQLRCASPETLVWTPLVSLPLEAADRAALQTSQLADPDLADGSELCARVQRHLQAHPSMSHRDTAGGSRQLDVTQRSLLWTALGRVVRPRSDASASRTPSALFRVLALALGSGVECCGVTLPDPAEPTNVLAMQHLVNRLNTPRGGVSAHSREHVSDVAEQMRMLSVDLHATAAATAQYGVAPLFDPPSVDLKAANGNAQQDARGVCGQTCFTYAFALQLPGLHVTADTPARNDGGEVNVDASSADPWAPSLARVLALTDVPAAFSPLIHAWYRDAYSTNKEGCAEACPSPLVLPAASRTIASLSEWLQPMHAHTAARRASDVTLQRAEPAPLMLRIEEMAELACAFCGGRGHVWTACHRQAPLTPRLLPDALRKPSALVSRDPAQTTAADQGNVAAYDADGTEGASAAEREAFAALAARTAYGSRLVLHVDDVAAALRAPDDQPHHASSVAVQNGLSALDHDVVRVPNRGLTAPLNRHALRQEQQKPPMHRRTVRCAYCHGQHHVTACPRLEHGGYGGTATTHNNGQGDDALTAAELAAVQKEAPDALFCIRCGRTGHLFFDCPQVPTDVHPATHCPVCLQPQSKSARPHRPEMCPRAVKVPAGHSARGVASYVLAERASLSRARTARLRQQNRQRRGSVLMADSFVDRR